MTTPAELLERLLAVEARLMADEAEKSKLRAELERAAKVREAEDGAVPTFKVRGVGQATLAGVDKLNPTVVDPPAYQEWVTQYRPEHVTLVVEVPLSQIAGLEDEAVKALHDTLDLPGVQWRHEVHPSLAKWIAENVASPDGKVVMVEGGEIVSGMEMTPAPVRLQVRFDAEAKRRALAESAGPITATDEMVKDSLAESPRSEAWHYGQR